MTKMPSAIAADTSVASSFGRKADGQYAGLTHTFIGSSCEPSPWVGVMMLNCKKLPNLYAVRIVACASLLWLAGVGLRLSILAVPPVILSIHANLRLSGTEVGILSGLPMVLFAIAALPGSLFIARLGAMPTLVIGFLIAGVASALRGAILDAFALYAATIVMSAGIAITQPALPPLVRQWLPHHVSLGTAIYTNALLMGETLPVMFTIPLVLPFVDESWRWAL